MIKKSMENTDLASENGGECLLLSDITEGTRVMIDSLECDKDIKQRLCSLGILKGQTIEMIKNDSDNPVMIKVFDSKIALGREQAKCIRVRLI